MRISERIKRARMAAGVRKIDLAARVGVSPATITRWESGDREPDQDHVKLVADALGVPQAALWADMETDDAPPGWVRLAVVACAHDPAPGGHVMVEAHRVAGMDALAVRVFGDCMEPEIRAGDVLIVDTSAQPVDGARVAYRPGAGDRCCVRRLRISGETAILSADNPTHPPIVLPLAEARARIIGRVRALCWRGIE